MSWGSAELNHSSARQATDTYETIPWNRLFGVGERLSEDILANDILRTTSCKHTARSVDISELKS
jgi:hypothetical protein